MSDIAGRRFEEHPSPRGEAEARGRLEALFADFDRLTPFELERIGLRRPDAEAREPLLHAVAEAARATDRTVLLGEARAGARDAVLRRYSEGGMHPTWVGLNWGISQGTVEDRVAIVEALEDAAAVAVVQDVVDAEVAGALALDAALVVDMAAGEVSEGAFGRQVMPPAAGLHDTRGRWAAVTTGAVVLGAVGYGIAAFAVGTAAGLAVGIVAVGIVLALARRGPGSGSDDGPGDAR